jgi:hypothetical protein
LRQAVGDRLVGGEDVARDLLRDRWIVAALIAWLLVFIAPSLLVLA